jgi:hypothetical protein
MTILLRQAGGRREWPVIRAARHGIGGTPAAMAALGVE